MTRDLIAAAGSHPATRWCVTVVGPDGHAAGHGCARGRHPTPAFTPDGGTDPPRTGGAPRAVMAAPRAVMAAPRAAVMARPAGAAVGGRRPATAAVPAATVPATAAVLKATVPAAATGRPATTPAPAVPGTGRGTRRQARYHRLLP